MEESEVLHYPNNKFSYQPRQGREETTINSMVGGSDGSAVGLRVEVCLPVVMVMLLVGGGRCEGDRESESGKCVGGRKR